MKLAVIGSRGIMIDNLEEYVGEEVKELVSGGAKGVDFCAKTYAQKKGLKITEFLPDYKRFGRGAPLRRNLQIIEYSDAVLAFWDGKSKGTQYVIQESKRMGKPIIVHIIK